MNGGKNQREQALGDVPEIVLSRMNSRFVALLGRKDFPTDAVEEYCSYLASALLMQGIKLEISRVCWAEKGWKEGLADLRSDASKNPHTLFFVQYTALAWSSRGFSWGVLRVIRLLKNLGARVVMVFHDVEPYFGGRTVDRVRRSVQLHTMREAVRRCDLSIFTVPVDRITWAKDLIEKTDFIPVGANLPAPERAWKKVAMELGKPPTIGMFALSSGRLAVEEAKLTAEIFAQVTGKLGTVRLAVMGRNSAAAEQVLRESLQRMPVEVVVYGVLSGEQIVNALALCDVLLFLRGPISSRRGSAIAGVACGLPVIAREGAETTSPITEAGLVLLPATATVEFGPALVRVLQDHTYRSELAKRSRNAQEQYFCWQVIAAAYAKLLQAEEA